MKGRQRLVSWACTEAKGIVSIILRHSYRSENCLAVVSPEVRVSLEVRSWNCLGVPNGLGCRYVNLYKDSVIMKFRHPRAHIRLLLHTTFTVKPLPPPPPRGPPPPRTDRQGGRGLRQLQQENLHSGGCYIHAQSFDPLRVVDGPPLMGIL